MSILVTQAQSLDLSYVLVRPEVAILTVGAEDAEWMLDSSNCGVQATSVFTTMSNAAEMTEILTKIGYFITGIGQFVHGSLTLYWSYKKSQFYTGVRMGLDGCRTTREKADLVYRVFNAQIGDSEKEANEKLKEFQAKFKTKSVEAKEAAFIQDYENALGSWKDYFSDLKFQIYSEFFALFGKKYRGENLVKKRHEQLKGELAFFRTQMGYLRSQEADKEDISHMIDVFQKERLKDLAIRGHLESLRNLVSSEFASEFYINRNEINLNLSEHQVTLIKLYEKAEEEYRSTRVIDIIEGIAYVLIGISSIALAATITGSLIDLITGILGAVLSVRAMLSGVELARYLLGAKMPQTFAEEVHALFNVFKEERVRQIDIYQAELQHNAT